MNNHALRYFDDYATGTLAEAVNQDGRTVMRCTAINFFRVRPASGA